MPFDIVDASNLLLEMPKLPPIIRGWNRLEGRPRTIDYQRALRAEVRDALWFLTRQWQFGEFQGEDTGSPIDARMVLRETQLARYAARGEVGADYERALPLETRVEREAIPFDLTLHVQVSRYFFGLIADHVAPARLDVLRSFYRTHYPLSAASLVDFADADTRAVLALAARNSLDCRALLHAIRGPAHAALLSGAPELLGGEDAMLKSVGDELDEWFEAVYGPAPNTGEQAWAPQFLEYQFSCATHAKDLPATVLAAEAYTSGHLDWYAFDVDARTAADLGPRDDGRAAPAAEERALSFIPAPVVFGGMPNPRYWEMENRKTEFADIDQNTTDVAKLLLTEFALVYSNDWCVIPHEVDVGSVCETRGLMLTDDFGEQILIRAAGRGVDDAWQRWSMYTLSTNGAASADTRLFVPPALTRSLEGEPIEKAHFLRDEMANMVWAIERIVPTALGVGANGYDVARAAQPPAAPAPALHPTIAKIRYSLGTDVPHNWFPFIPVHRAGSHRDVELQRARMPETSRKIRGAVLSHASPYFINEEEVPRAGKLVTRAWQRARWLDGSTFLWIGRRVTTGKGEGSSGLAFDQVVDIKQAP